LLTFSLLSNQCPVTTDLHLYFSLNMKTKRNGTQTELVDTNPNLHFANVWGKLVDTIFTIPVFARVRQYTMYGIPTAKCRSFHIRLRTAHTGLISLEIHHVDRPTGSVYSHSYVAIYMFRM
jgi:hypothetical protein